MTTQNNKRGLFLSLCLALIVGAGFVFLMLRTQPQPLKLGYVQADYLFQNYAGSMEAYADMQTQTADWSQDLDSLSNAYKAVFASYSNQKQQLEKTQRQQLEQQLKQQQTAFERYHTEVEEQRQALDERMTKALVTQIDSYLRDYAQEQGYDMIFTTGKQGNLAYSKEIYNITEPVLAYLNKRYKDE